MNYKVLIADDNIEALKSFEYQLKSYKEIQPMFVSSAKEARRIVEKDSGGFAAIVLDFHFVEEKINGAELALELLKNNPNLLIIICTGDETQGTVVASLRAQVKDFVVKDDIDGFMAALRRCFAIYDEHHRVLEEDSIKNNLRDNENFMRSMGIISRSDGMREICETIQQSCNEKATVLIHGESGTGKELVARAFHTQSNRSGQNFVAINCAALPANLLESELFGYVKGAFTGANTSKPGQLERAHKGTLFLDEIGELPMELQAKLLRAIQEGTFLPLGGREEITVDVRIIAATNVNLKKAISEGRFREDLYYRLRVIEVNLPPLRERKEDIEPLVVHFQNKFSKKSKKRLLYKTLQVLSNYDWPGNVRELENVIESLFVLAKTEDIGPEHLPKYFFEIPGIDGDDISIDRNNDYKSFMKILLQFTNRKEHNFLIHRVQVEKSIRKASEKLRIPRATLQRKLLSMGYSDLKSLTNKEAL